MLKSLSQFGLHIKNYDSKNDARAKYFKKSFWININAWKYVFR